MNTLEFSKDTQRPSPEERELALLQEIQDHVEAQIKRQKRHQQRQWNSQRRREAKAKGERVYVGTPCTKAGHGALRRTSGGDCVECAAAASRAYRQRKKAELEALRAQVAQLEEG